ncbi:MAG: hypothetical protein GX496_08510, partial [Firmicutes bacterium]|nr:hypothetical protein [Bacillota bacterium]
LRDRVVVDVSAALARAVGLRPVVAGDLLDAALAEQVVALLLGLGSRHRRRSVGLRFTHLAPP